MMRSPIRPLLAIATVASLALAACGGDDDASSQDDGSDSSTETSDAADTTEPDTSQPDTSEPDTSDTSEADTSDTFAPDSGASAYSPGDTIPGDDATGRPEVVLPSEAVTELVVTDLVVGDGEAAEAGDTVVVNLVGVLSADGTVFADSYVDGQPFELPVGSAEVFPGWEEASVGLQAGGRRQLDIPAAMAFGEAGDGGSIPPNADLTLVIDVIEVVEPPPPPTLAPQADAADCPAPDGSSEPQQEFDEYPPTCIDVTKDYTAEIVTNHGTFIAELDPEEAPVAVNNFVVLARYHYFDDTECHRAIPEFMVQCGDPTATGSGGPGYQFADELPDGGEYQIGSLAMANSGADTNGSQFFIITGPNGVALPPQYSLFGQVTEGLDDTLPTLDALGNPDPAANGVPPLEPIIIESVTITES